MRCDASVQEKASRVGAATLGAWPYPNLLQTVPLLAVLASATAVFGSTTLGHLSKAAVAPVAGARGSASASLVKQD